MNVIHLYIEDFAETEPKASLCDVNSVYPGIDGVPVRKNQGAVGIITYCKKCMESEDRALWILGNI